MKFLKKLIQFHSPKLDLLVGESQKIKTGSNLSMYYTTLQTVHNGTSSSIQSVAMPLYPCQLKPQFRPIDFQPSSSQQYQSCHPPLDLPRWDPTPSQIVEGIKTCVRDQSIDNLGSYARKYFEKNNFSESDWEIVTSVVLLLQNARKLKPHFRDYSNAEITYTAEKHFLNKLIKIAETDSSILWDENVKEIVSNCKEYVYSYDWITLLSMMNKHMVMELKDLLKTLHWLKLVHYKNKFLQFILCQPNIGIQRNQ